MAIFLMSYYNTGLLLIIRFENKNILPCIFTPKWLVFYGKMIVTSLILSNFMPYLGPIIKSVVRRGCFCCKKSKIKTHLNEDFPMVKRYAAILKTVFICFTYGFAIPMLFVVAFFVLFVQFFLDKLLVAFYYRERTEHNDTMNRFVLRVLKYGASVFLLASSVQIAANHCMVNNGRAA
jgi:hypothetical protein